MKNFFIYKYIPALIYLLCFSGCTNKKNIEQKISINIEFDFNTLDPRKARTLNDYNLIKCFNEGLFRHDKKGLSKAIANSYEISKDQKRYTIKLKKTLWSNNDPLTAHHFIYAWTSLLEKDFPSPYAYFLFYIKNGKEIKEGLLPKTALCAKAIDNYTLEIELTKPIPFFLELLSLPVYLPVHKDVDIKTPNWHNNMSAYVCNGPFYPKTVKKGDSITALKNKTYWDKDNVFLDTIYMVMVKEHTAYNLFQNKELQFIGAPFSNIPTEALFQHLKEGSANSSPFLATTWLRTNVNTPPLNNKNLRKALGLAIDRETISDHIFGGSVDVATSIVPASFGLHQQPIIKDKDFKMAKIYCDKALKELGSIRPLVLSFVNTQEGRNIALVLQDIWKKNLGITIELEPLERKTFFQKQQNGTYDLAYGRKIADFKDPVDFLEAFKTKDSGLNNTGWENKKYQAAISQSYLATTPLERKTLCSAAEKIILDEMPVIPMHHQKMIYLVDKRLKNLVFSEVGIIDFKSAYLAEVP